ncbi:MAG: tryptophan--tRNA ligase [Pseudomonadota bacterium]
MKQPQKHQPRVVSGVQPTGNLHLGNYLGAIREFVTVQHEMQSIFPVVDLHAITVLQDPKVLAENTRGIAAAYLAAGIDPDIGIIFNQSAVHEHAELAWIVQCVARFGWLNRMTQFKEKSGGDRESVSVGLLTYPALMAADILVYKGTHVPVGEDQRQHLEFTRDFAAKFNNDFNAPDFFPMAQAMVREEGARIMSLRDGRSKMSKSDPSDMSRILLTDDADAISKKIKKSKSDPEPLPETVDGLVDRPEAENLVGIYAALSATSKQDVLNEFGGQGFGVFKPALADLTVESLAPVSERMRQFLAAPDHVESVLRQGAEKARTIAQPIVKSVRDIVGLL